MASDEEDSASCEVKEDASDRSYHLDDSDSDLSDDEINRSYDKNEPHALVHYRNSSDANQEPEIVHFSRIMNYSPKMLTNPIDRSRLHKVFWSNIPGDSPVLMLKRVAKIPVFDINLACSEPGYYRATIAVVKESRKAVKLHMKSKRVVTLPKHSLTMSFDGSQDTKYGANAGKRALRNRKAEDKAPDQLKEKKVQNSKNKVALSDAILKVDSSLSKVGKSAVKNKRKGSSKKAAPDSTSTEGSDDELASPSKLKKLEGEISMHKATINKINGLNLRLQEKLQASEEECLRIRQELDDSLLRASNRGCKKGLCKTISDLSCEDTLGTSDNSFDASEVCKVVYEAPTYSDTLDTKEQEDDLPPLRENDAARVKSVSPVNRPKEPKLMEPTTSKEAEVNQVVGYELYPGRIMPETILKIFKDIPEEEKKDLRFIKNAAVYIIGPEVLASSSIDGTKKGLKKKDGDTPVAPKPAIEKKLFEALEKEDVKRRMDSNRIKQSIRDKQKKLRNSGYGFGSKPSSLPEEEVLRSFE